MIFPADWPLEASCPALRALYVALNSPVVRQDPLPVGPASAVVALHRDLRGVSVAVRSVRTGRLAFFTTDPENPPSPEMGIDAALSFAETLGFVFDENQVGPDGAGAQRAAELWCEVIGEEYQGESLEGAAQAGCSSLMPAGRRALPVGVAHDQAAAALRGLAPGPERFVDAGTLTKLRWALGPGIHPEEPNGSIEPRSPS